VRIWLSNNLDNFHFRRFITSEISQKVLGGGATFWLTLYTYRMWHAIIYSSPSSSPSTLRRHHDDAVNPSINSGWPCVSRGCSAGVEQSATTTDPGPPPHHRHSDGKPSLTFQWFAWQNPTRLLMTNNKLWLRATQHHNVNFATRSRNCSDGITRILTFVVTVILTIIAIIMFISDHSCPLPHKCTDRRIIIL